MPGGWEQIIGHARAVRLLQRSLAVGSLAHAYLFVGPPRVGKAALANILAQAVNCPGENPPCGTCSTCQRIQRSTHPDVEVISLGPSQSGANIKEIAIDRVREMERTASLKPFEGRARVYVIDGAEHLSGEAANALLKTLEEPPEQVFLLLLAVSENDLLPTIRSRCQRVLLGPVGEADIRDGLMRKFSLAEDKASLLARLSEGRIGWAIEAATNEALLSHRQEKIQELVSLLEADVIQRLSFAGSLQRGFYADRTRVQDLLEDWRSWWREVLLVQTGSRELSAEPDAGTELTVPAASLSPKEAADFIHRLIEAQRQLSQNASPMMVFDLLLLHLPKIAVQRLP